MGEGRARPKVRRPIERRSHAASRPHGHTHARPESKSLKDRAYESIKHQIITCTFKPGEYLNEAFVSATLGIGRTPVHQAIDRLMLDGLLDVIPRKGLVVKPVSLDEIIQIVEVRLVNEAYCVRLAADRAETGEIRDMESVLADADKALAGRDIERMMLLDREFHGLLARASNNTVLADILSKLHDRSLRLWFISLNNPGHHAAVQKEHNAILAAVRDRDPDGAEAAMRAHIESFRSNILRSV